MTNSIESLADFEQNGFLNIAKAVAETEIDQLTTMVEEIRRDNQLAGLRNLLNKSEAVRNFATTGVAANMASQLLGGKAFPVRAILFDKTPTSNWYVTWHQDLSIPVKEKVEIDGFGPWSVKDGVQHVQPPAFVLENMVSLRIHLDECATENGAIKFLAGTHKRGILNAEDIATLRESGKSTEQPAARGDIIAMRPLILHSSSVATQPNHRRVLHLEYSGVDLPSGLEWGEA